MKRKAVSILLALCLLAGCLPLSAAAAPPVVSTGLAEDGTFTTTTVWEDGKTALATKNDFVQILVKASDGEVMADVTLPAEPGTGKAFADVKSGDWYEKDVAAVTALGLFFGTSETHFSPNAPMTRAMLATVLHRLGGASCGVGSGSFADVPADSWYAGAVNWAQAIGVVTGTGHGFDPDGMITREQLVAMLFRYAAVIGEQGGAYEYDDFWQYSDWRQVSTWAEEAMRWAITKGFIRGRGSAGLAPQSGATRAEVAAILTRFVDYLRHHNHPNAHYTCVRCGRTAAVAEINRSDYCSDCHSLYYCTNCNQYVDWIFEGFCDGCAPHCINCGVPDHGRGQINGYCEDCYALLFP